VALEVSDILAIVTICTIFIMLVVDDNTGYKFKSVLKTNTLFMRHNHIFIII
jgi:hypothetical protein